MWSMCSSQYGLFLWTIEETWQDTEETTPTKYAAELIGINTVSYYFKIHNFRCCCFAVAPARVL
jgi:hypothetical protein